MSTPTLHILRNAALSLWLLMAVTACGPKIKSSPKLDDMNLRTIAILPSTSDQKVAREKVDAMTILLASELRTAGFQVLDVLATQKLCDLPACANRSHWAQNYTVDGFAQLHLKSISRANFLAGYYNAVKGDLSITEPGGTPLFEVSHTESERGGLLFNLGQIIQGVISQIKNADPESSNTLAAKFVETIVARIPAPKTPAAANATNLISIESVKTEIMTGNITKICATGTAGAQASLLQRGQRSSLRETSPGEYCGVFRLDDLSGWKTVSTYGDGNPLVELRTVYGGSVTKPLDIGLASACSLKDNLLLTQTGSQNQVQLNCTDPSSGKLAECNLNNCQLKRLVVYRAFNEAGPFEKVGETDRTSWQERSTKAGTPIYQVVAIDARGIRSTPVRAIAKRQENT